MMREHKVGQLHMRALEWRRRNIIRFPLYVQPPFGQGDALKILTRNSWVLWFAMLWNLDPRMTQFGKAGFIMLTFAADISPMLLAIPDVVASDGIRRRTLMLFRSQDESCNVIRCIPLTRSLFGSQDEL